MSDNALISDLPARFVRDDRWDALLAAITFGVSRCGSDEERSLIPALAALLAPFNATVLPAGGQTATGVRVDLRITLSRVGADGRSQRLRFVVRSESHSQGALEGRAAENAGAAESAGATESAGAAESREGAEESWIQVSAAQCCRAPWRTAAWIVGEALQRATGLDSRSSGAEVCVDSG